MKIDRLRHPQKVQAAVAQLDPRRDDDLVAREAHLLKDLRVDDRAAGVPPVLRLPAGGVDGNDLAVRFGDEALDDVAVVLKSAADEAGQESLRVAARVRVASVVPCSVDGRERRQQPSPSRWPPHPLPAKPPLSTARGYWGKHLRGGRIDAYTHTERRRTIAANVHQQAGACTKQDHRKQRGPIDKGRTYHSRIRMAIGVRGFRIADV